MKNIMGTASLKSVLHEAKLESDKELVVTIVGKGNSHTGIGSLTHGWLRALVRQPGIKLRFINTRPEEGDDVAMTGVKRISVSEGHADPGDVCVFTDVVWNGEGDRNYEMCPPAKIKYCYAVFDSTKVPQEWIDITNTHFNAVIVTSPFLIKVFKDCGSHRPVFHIPHGMELAKFRRLPPKKPGACYNFGVVGAFDIRKNVKLIAESFAEAFGLDNPNVCLKMKLTYSLFPEEEVQTFIDKYVGSNIEITRGKIDDKAYLEFVSSIDCLVNISRGEGYSIPAREAVAMGKPIILSDCFAHQDLIGIDSVHFVRSEIPVPALYPQINERFIGLQFVPHRLDVIAAFHTIYEHRFNYANLGIKNRDRANIWSVDYLRPLYKSAVDPINVSIRGGPDTFNELGISTADADFYKSAFIAFGPLVCRSARNPVLVGATSKKVVVVGNDGGFFSLFNRYASYLVWEKEASSSTIVLPDWSARSIKEFYSLDNFTSFCYASESEGNGWLQLFEPSPDIVDVGIYNDITKLYSGATIADDFNEKREPWLTYVHAYELYQMPEFKRWRNWYHDIISPQIRPVASIKNRVERNMELLGDSYRIGVHIRHPSHAIEQPGARLSHIEAYVNAINDFIARKSIKNPKIFLATDQDMTIEEMRSYFGDLVVFDPSIKRTTIADDTHFMSLTAEEKMREGHQIQHLTAANPKNWSSEMAVEVIADCYSLASCQVLFHIVSNISTAASYINPELEMMFVGDKRG